ncbi:tail fiber domain-containing protein [Halobacteriovorax marinus]|uniref:tail fiber domain-containing protein n=1 Tax=Halobacteriovorax marinus TaxID=97084 RepID=UPI003A93D5A7
MNNMLLKIFLLFLSTSITFASEKISYSGRLTSANGAPISGPVSITLDIVTSTPTTLCSITDTSVPLSNGVFHLEVDYGTTCDSSRSLKQIISDAVNASEELFIRVTDNTHTKVYPAQAITSTPLATYALEAASVREGSIVNTDLKGVAANCANNEVIAGDGSGNFKCISASTGSVTSITAGTGLTGGTITSSGTIAVDVGAGAGNIPQLDGSGKLVTSVETDPNVLAFAKSSLPTCNAGEVLKSDGTSFSCVTDDVGTDSDTTYTAGTGIDLTAGQFSIDASACPAGQRMIFGAPGFGCEDADAISLQGNDVDNAAPNDNDVLTWNNATSKWEPRATAATVTNLDDLSDAATTTDNLFLGHSNTMGTSNTGVGITSLDALTTGNFNTSIGDGSLTANQSGSNNVAIGYNAGASNVSGSGNVFLGNGAGENETGSNKLYIDNSNTATPLIQGDFSTDIVTINGKLKIVDGTEGATKVLTSSADGTASWTSLSGAGSVTSVDVTAPLVKGGTASDVDLSIPAATTSNDGYLSSTDWNIFNLKQDAITTGSTAQYIKGDLSLGTFVDDVLASVLTGYSAGANTPLAATDTIVGAFSKVQGQINANQTSISTNASDIATNATDIATNVSAISTNATNISSNDTDISQNATDIATNASDIAQNTTDIAAINESQWTTTGNDIYYNTGNVGIGTDSPYAKIDVNAGSFSGTVTPLRSVYKATVSPSSSNGFSLFEGSGASTFASSQVYGLNLDMSGGSGSNHYGIYVTGEDKNSFSGNVGIGTTNPVTKAQIRTSGSSNYSSGTTSQVVGLPEGTGLYLEDSTSTAEADKFIGIGFSGVGPGGARRSAHIGAVTAGSTHRMEIVFGQKINNTSYVERMRIDKDGNVGIGVTDPDAKLEVAGQVKITGGTPGAGKVLTSDADGLASWTTPTSGTVSSVAATAPLSVTNPTTTPSLSITQANTSTNGYLSSTDWNTFNNKQSALPTGGATSQYLRGDYTLSTFVDDVLASALTGYTVGADTPLAATDSVLGAFSKVQGQINDNNTDISANATNIGTNTTNISNNASAISTNTGNISTNTTDIATNASNIASNDTDIAQNASDIAAINESQWENNGTRIYYDTDKVGIGTNAPNARLEVVNPSGSNDGLVVNQDGTGQIVSFSQGWDEKFIINNVGDVGIGTTSPSAKLDIAGSLGLNNTSYQWNQKISLPHADASTGKRVLIELPSTTHNAEVIVKTARSTNDVTGNVLAKFHTVLTSSNTVFRVVSAEYSNNLASYQWYFDTATGTPYLRIGQGGNSHVYSITIKSNIATTPTISVDDGTTPAFSTVSPQYAFRSSQNSDLHIQTAGDDRLTIDATGKIGINQPTPTSALHLTEADDSWSSSFRMDRSWDSSTDYFQMMYDYEGLKIRTMDASADDADIIFKPQDSEAVRILAGSGNLGVGTDNPTEKLEVSGNVKATAFYGDGSNLTGITADSSSNNVNAIINADADSNSSGEILLQTAGTTRASISNTGDMTLGSAVNSGTGVTSFSVGSATEPSVISLGEDASNNSAITWNNTSNYVSIGTTNASTAYNETLVVRNGKVGIGTNNPVDKLTVKGDTSSLRLESTSSNINNSSSIVFAENATDDHFMLRYDGADSVEGSGALTFSGMSSGDILTLNRGGKVGIGTTAPSVKFQVQTEDLGTAWKAVNDNFAYLSQDAWQTLVSTSADTWGSSIMLKQVDHATKAYENSWSISRQTNSNGTGDGSLRFNYGTDVSPTENPAMVTFETNGRVGIGTVDPSEQLEVNGNVKAASYLYTSDKRFKKNITLVEAPIAKVDALRGVLFDWRNDEYNDLNLPEGRDYGFIAQEVEEVAPELVHTDDNGYKSVKYANITSILVEAVKSLKDKFNKYFEDNDKEVKELGRKVASLEEENKELKKKSLENERRIEEMEKNLKEILKTMNSNNKNN